MEKLPKIRSRQGRRNQLPTLLFGSVGLAVFSVGAYNATEGYLSSGWPRVPGMIVESKVFETTTNGRHPTTVYVASVHYSFSVDGIVYTNHRVSFNNFSGGDPDAGKKIQHRYPVGKAVLVSYCPHKPNISVLKPGVSPLTLTFCSLGLILIGFGVYGGASGKRKDKGGAH